MKSQFYKFLTLYIFGGLAMLLSTGCASNGAHEPKLAPPVAQANYCSEYLCLALQPLFKEIDFIAPEITINEILGTSMVYSLDYEKYGLITVELLQKNQVSHCTNPKAFVQINEEKKVAFDVNCFADSDSNGQFLKISYLPNNLNDLDEFKFLSLISHVWVGQNESYDTDGRTSLELKYSL